MNNTNNSKLLAAISFDTLPEAVQTILEQVQVINHKIDNLPVEAVLAPAFDENRFVDINEIRQIIFPQWKRQTIYNKCSLGELPHSKIGSKLLFNLKECREWRDNQIQKGKIKSNAEIEAETDKQYSKCLKSHGHDITIKTLYHLAKSAGVSISVPPVPLAPKQKQIAKSPNCQNGNLAISEKTPLVPKVPQNINQDSDNEETEALPTIPEKIYPLLPDFLKRITDYSNSREDADLLLLGSLVVTSACMPNIYGIYGGVTVFPNLFLFVSAQASAGKGRLSLCRRLVEPIHRQLREINRLELDEYRRQQIEYAANKKNPDVEQPKEPPLRVLFVPANSSATAVFQILNDNQGVGLMFETEGDTLAQTFKSEHGNYSDGFRKAFHHEKISYLRRKDREYITLETPKLSALLSGTPRQVQSLIPDAENGLFSRFMFYCMNIRLQWNDVFACNENESLDQHFNRFGDVFFDFYQTLKQHQNIRFSFSNSQQVAFNQYFEQIQQQYWELLGNDYIGTIRRLGLITFRIAMVLTTLRTMDVGAHPCGISVRNIKFTVKRLKAFFNLAQRQRLG